MRGLFLHIWMLIFILAALPHLHGQEYFGKNKPRYTSFDFEVSRSPHFEFYTYTKNNDLKEHVIRLTEEWYHLHQAVLRDTFNQLNPVIFYNNHADFQQTNAIFGTVGVGTGGVTEGFKNRVIMPFTMINQQTDQVLAHELVHAFQYDMILNGDSTSLQSLGNLPLWMVEGMAEYLSIGRVDPFTSMWMRDAFLNDDIPTIKELSNPKYFPYRYGQAFWSFFSGYFGDDKIKDLFMMTAQYGLDIAVDSVLNLSTETLSGMFTESMKTHYRKMLGEGAKETPVGTRILSDENAGRMNISPVLSPNGRYLIFFSDKNLFTTDLYLADARNGKIIRKVNSLLRDGHYDDFNFLESSGTWSPRSDQFAFVAFKNGRNVIVIKEVSNGKTVDEIKVKDVPAIGNPAWSPDGKHIVFTGMVDGQADLFMYNLRSKRVTQLTDDLYSEVQANWSPDGSKLAFATDRLSKERGRTFGRWTLNIAEMDVATREIENLDIFFGADNTDPNYDEQGRLYFLSDRDGYKNLYRYDMASDSLLQMTDFKTGISGIGRYSPALSASKTSDRVVFSHYYGNSYHIYQARTNRMLHQPVSPDDVDLSAALLPVVGLQAQENLLTGKQPLRPGSLGPYADADDASRNLLDLNSEQIVTRNFLSLGQQEKAPELAVEIKPAKYNPRFRLDHIQGSAGGGIGVGTFNTQTAFAGGVGMIFSDIMGNNQLFVQGALNGEIYDFAIAAQYLNQKRRLAWGVGFSHVPIRTGFYNQFIDTSNYNARVAVLQENLIRIFQEELSFFVQYPFSKTLRWEASIGGLAQFYRYDRRDFLFDPVTWPDLFFYIGQGRREKVPLEEAESALGVRFDSGLFYNASTAIVGDNSFFGVTSPLGGYRYRLGYSHYAGLYDFQSVTADLRYYHYMKPVSLAFRATHFGRMGKDANSFFPILIGQMGLVRGFDFNQVRRMFDETGVSLSQFSGSKIIVTGFEVRLPFTGPERLSAIKSSFLFTDLALFLDAGIAFNNYDDIGKQQEGVPPQEWAISTGLSVRINLFGAMILEPYYAIPLVKGARGGAFGINFVPGW